MIRGFARPYSIKVLSSLVAFCVWLTGVSAVLSGNDALAQDASQRPPHASEAVSQLEGQSWETIADGLFLLKMDTALGTRMTALRIDTSKYRFSIEEQIKRKGEKAAKVRQRLDADIVVNGGFFLVDGDETLKPVGMLIKDGLAKSRAWIRDGGYLALDRQGKPSITLSPDGPPMWARDALQSKPVLIEPGGKWAMNTNGTELEARTLLCLLPDNKAILLIVHGGGLTLFEAGWVLRGREWGGYFNCDSALALDGGSSTQLSVKDRPDLKISGLSRVQNFIVVSKR